MSSNVRDIEPDPTVIGNVAKPPFARLPDPKTIFDLRARRYRELATAHDLAPYLRFLGALSQVQHDIQDGLPEPELPPAEMLARAAKHKMPPLDRGGFKADAAFDATLARLLERIAGVDMPPPAKDALARVKAADAPVREAMIDNVLADSIPVEAIADHVFVAAALQVHFARLAARLKVDALKSLGNGVCPACGGAPVASLIVGWQGAEGARFCSCSLCATLWYQPRVQCMICGSNKNVTYQEVEGGPATVKAEICGSCHGYLKVFHQQQDPALDPVADDVGSLGLDLLVREMNFRRGGINPFLLGY